MSLHRKYISLCVLLACGVLVARGGSAAEWASPTWSGSVGYNYRSLQGDAGAESTSHQGLGSLSVNSYLWRPWVGTMDLSTTVATNATTTEGKDAGSTEADSRILTGDLNLNILPQSRAPLNLRYAQTDTRIDYKAVNTDSIIVLNDGDATAKKLGLTQSYVWEAGHRLRAIYDNNEWTSDKNGDYTDETVGAEMDFRGAGYHMISNAKKQESTRSIGSLVNQTTAFDTTHYYYPTQTFRLDSRYSQYNTERGFDVPSLNDQSGTSMVDIKQASSFGFYRPAGSPWSLSGGLRVFNMAGENDGDAQEDNETQSASGTAGGFYRYNQRLRYDFSGGLSKSTGSEIDSEVKRGRAGILYQSDLKSLNKFMYQWYSSLSLDGVGSTFGEESETSVGGNAVLGHNLQRVLASEGALMFRVSGAQTLGGSYINVSRDSAIAEDETLDMQRLEHSVTLSMNHNATGATSYGQLTLSDGRSLGSTKMDQQMVWFQLYRDQRVTSQSTLSGNLSLQYVNHNYESSVADVGVTTSTAKISYRTLAFLWMPKLHFLSDFMVSQASEEEGVDRQEWENRFDYAIGQLTTSLSHRVIDYDERQYKLTFFRIERHF